MDKDPEDDNSGVATPPPEFVNQTQTPNETMRAAHHQIDASLAQKLLDRIRSAPPEFFERLIVNLLLSMGFGGSVAPLCRRRRCT
ncbi:MAG: hypothetical protein WAL59_11500 [Roseiarcus sp.]